VSSRARFTGCVRCGVVEYPLVDDVGQMPFEGAERFHRGFAFGEAAPVVGAAGGIPAQLDDGHDVQDPVDAPIPGAGEPVAALVTRGRLERGGAVPGREVRRGGEPADVGDVGDQPGSAGRTNPMQLGALPQPGAKRRVVSLVECLRGLGAVGVPAGYAAEVGVDDET